MEIIAYISALIIGISLGLIGGGGSILTVPVLVYLMGIAPTQATAYSLFIVGFTSLIGSYNFYKKQLLEIKTALIFGAPSIVAVFLTRKFLVPAIPDYLFSVGSIEVSRDLFLMLLFAILMLAASFSMIKKSPEKESNKPKNTFNFPLIFLEGAVVGVLTGLVGAGGGFLIIPALVMLTGMEMKKAVGTSLFIIAVKSIIGFLGDLGHFEIDWFMLLLFTSISVAGIFIGSYISNGIDGKKLKTSFGWFVLIMGVYIIIKELSAA